MKHHNNRHIWRIVETSWQNDSEALAAIRRWVFIEEQHVPEPLEWDGLDENAAHFIAYNPAGHAIGCARVLAQGHIGRMAVLPAWRRQGVGLALLQACVRYCQQLGWNKLQLSAQIHAIPLYQKVGFTVTSKAYLDAGILHQDMTLDIA